MLQDSRCEKGWSQKQAADKVGVTVRSWRRWEHRVCKPQPYYQQKLVEVFGLSLEQLGFTGEKEQPSHITQQEQQPLPERSSEQPGTYFIQDRSKELLRLHIQDALITQSIGGVLPEQDDPSQFQRILDVGCGTGSWLIECAKTYPAITQLVGVDISRTMVEYAQSQAVEAGIQDRVQFYVMDALRMLEFPKEYFDLVNQRFGMSYLRTWDWSNLLREYKRVARRGGMLRIIEGDPTEESSSAALLALSDLLSKALYRAGHSFQETYDVSTALVPLIERSCSQVQVRHHTVAYHVGEQGFSASIADSLQLFIGVKPFLEKWGCLPAHYDALYQQLSADVQQPAFYVSTQLHTIYGIWP